MTTIGTAPTIEALFADWKARMDAHDAGKDSVAECEAICAVEAAVLTVPPSSLQDLYRKIAMVLDDPLPDDLTFEAQLAREARAAVGLPVSIPPRGATNT